MGCIGIELCGKKNCIEQERCCQWPIHVNFIPRGSKKHRNKRHENKEPVQPMCEMNKKWCTNERVCEILGQCILKHPLVLADKMAAKQLRKHLEINSIIKIITRLMPSLNRKTKRK